LRAWLQIPDVEIIAICDRDPVRLGETGAAFGITRRYDDAAAMIAEQKLDFVDIATMVSSHEALVTLAAQHGLAVICQKPFTETLAAGIALVELCRARGVMLMVHENFRWQAPIRAVRDCLAAGQIGTPFWGRVSFRSAYDVHAGQPYLAEGEKFILQDLGIHLFDIARFLFGDAEQISARTQRVNPAIRGEDVATALLSHRGGITSVVDCSYASGLEQEIFPQTLLEVDGDAGTLRLSANYQLTVASLGSTERRLVAPDRAAWGPAPWDLIQESVFNIQRHFVHCLRLGETPETSGTDNLRTLALVDAAYSSAADSGRSISLHSVIGSCQRNLIS
jgi:predicted dehydrogenase